MKTVTRVRPRSKFTMKFNIFFRALMQRKYIRGIYKALIVGVLLHMPFVFLIIYLRQDSDTFLWRVNIPGWGGGRPYNYFVEVGVVVGIGMLVIRSTQEKLFNVFLLVAISLSWMMLFWGGGRGAIVGILGALVISSIVAPHFAKKIWIVAGVTCVVGAVLSLLIWTPDSPSFGLLNMLTRTGSETLNRVSTGRIVMWLYAIESIKEHPFWGYGLEQFIFLQVPRISASANVHLHVHNLILEVILSWGLIGASVFAVLFTRLCVRVLTRVRPLVGREKLPAFLPLVALLGHGLFSGTYFHIHSLIYMAIFFGICLAPNPAQNENTNG